MWQDIFKRNPQIVKRRIAGDVILVPISDPIAKQQRIFSLNEMGEYIWDRLDGNLCLAEILETVLQKFAVNEAQAKEDVMHFMQSAIQQGLIKKQE